MSCPYARLIVGKWQCRVLISLDIGETAVPCPYARLIVGKRHCRVLISIANLKQRTSINKTAS